MNYDFFYNIKNYSCDDEYQKEFLNVFKITDIMDPELSITLDKIFNHVKDIEEWNLLIDTHIGEWVQSIHNHAPDANILLCGTHVDKIPRSKRDKVLKRILDMMIRKAKEIRFPVFPGYKKI